MVFKSEIINGPHIAYHNVASLSDRGVVIIHSTSMEDLS